MMRVFAVAMVLCVASVWGQAPPMPTPPASNPSATNNSMTNVISPTGSSDILRQSPGMRARVMRLRKVERMRRLSTSTNRLLELTKQFQAEVSERGTLTPADERMLDEIAKAAHEVRSRMAE